MSGAPRRILRYEGALEFWVCDEAHDLAVRGTGADLANRGQLSRGYIQLAETGFEPSSMQQRADGDIAPLGALRVEPSQVLLGFLRHPVDGQEAVVHQPCPRAASDLAHAFGDRAIAVGNDVREQLDDAFAPLDHRSPDIEDHVVVEHIRGHRRSVEVDMGISFDAHRGQGDADGAGIHGLVDQAVHFGHFSRGGPAGLRSIDSHDIDEQRVQRQITENIDAFRQLLHPSQVFGKALPVPGQRRALVGNGDLLRRLQHLHGAFDVARPDRGNAESAIRVHNGCDSILSRVGAIRIPEERNVVVRMLRHMARRNDLALRIDDLLRLPVSQLADGGDLAVSNADIGVEGGAAGAVDHPSAADDGVESRHRPPSVLHEWATTLARFTGIADMRGMALIACTSVSQRVSKLMFTPGPSPSSIAPQQWAMETTPRRKPLSGCTRASMQPCCEAISMTSLGSRSNVARSSGWR